MFDIREHGGPFGGGGVTKGSVINITRFDSVMASINNLKQIYSTGLPWAMQNLANKRMVAMYNNSSGTTTIGVFEDGKVLFEVSANYTKVIPLNDGRFVVLDTYYAYLHDANLNKLSNTRLNLAGGGSAVMIAYEYEGRLVLVNTSLDYNSIVIDTWTMEMNGKIPGVPSGANGYSNLSSQGWDYTDDTIFCKMGGLGGFAVEFERTNTPTVKTTISTYDAMHASVNKDGSKFFTYNASTNLIEVYDTSVIPYVKLYSFTSKYATGSTNSNWSYINVFKHLDGENAILAEVNGQMLLQNSDTGALIRAVSNRGLFYSYGRPALRLNRQDKRDRFYLNAEDNTANIDFIQVVSTTVKVIS